MGGGSKESAVLTQLGLVQNYQKTVECDLKRKRNNHLFTGTPLNDTFANNEDQDKKLYNAVFHQGLYCLLRKKRFSDKNTFLNYNLTPLDLYDGLSLVYCIKREGRIH